MGDNLPKLFGSPLLKSPSSFLLLQIRIIPNERKIHMQNSEYSLLDDLSNSYSEKFGFMPNAPLVANWQQLKTQIDTMLSSRKGGIVVSQMPTGTGKTHCIVTYCRNCLSVEERGIFTWKYSHSILVVARTIEQGCEIASEINDGLSQPIAFATNSNVKADVNGLRHFPVLIITAEKYERLLLEIHDNSPFAELESKFMAGGLCNRSLTIIDESYGFTKNWIIDLISLRQLYASIIDGIGKDFPNEMEFIEELRDNVIGVNNTRVFDFKDSQIKYDFKALSSKVSGSNLHHVFNEGKDQDARRRLVSAAKEVLEALHQISTSYCVVRKNGNFWNIGTSVSLMPKDENLNILILDATASLFPLYEYMGEKVEILPRIDGSRDYSNLTIHRSFNNKVGKGDLQKNIARHSKCLTAAINEFVSNSEDLLIICPKLVLKDVQKLKHRLKSTSFATWGAIDGKNDWIGASSIFLFGLPYRDSFSPLLEYLALAGQQSSEWWQPSNDNERAKKSVVNKIKQGHMICSVIQALNRCRIRTSLNTDGLCPPTNIYLPLGTEKEAKLILDAIQTEMPNVRFGKLEYGDKATKKHGNKYVGQVLDYLSKNNADLPLLLKNIKEELSISKGSFDSFKKELKDGDGQLIARLAAIGWSYRSVGYGKGAKQWFERNEYTNLEEIVNVTT